MPNYIQPGERFGRLTALRCEGKHWRLRCDCGKEVSVATPNLRTGRTKSCGCYCREVSRKMLTSHGRYYTPEYKIWSSAKGRCRIPTNTSYPWYGALGIDMCQEWANDFMAFYRDMGPRPEGYTLERKDSKGNYEPSNCVWATTAAQGGTRKDNRILEHDGRRQHLAAWAREFGVNHTTLIAHLKNGRSMAWLAARYAGRHRSSGTR